MADEKKIALLKQLQELAKRGVGGEAVNAEKMLQKLMQQYDIREEDIAEEVIKPHEYKFKFKGGFSEHLSKLLAQVAFSVYGDTSRDKKRIATYVQNTARRRCIFCTDAEFLEIVAKFEFYRMHYEAEMKLFHNAFIATNHIFPPDALKLKGDDAPKYANSNQTEAETMRIAMLAQGLEKHHFRKQLAEGSK